MTPDQVHYGQADEVYAARQKTLDRAFQSNPERFVRKPPEPPLSLVMLKPSLLTKLFPAL
jgi:hypothetical protein